jgi:hypothetical protein
MIRSLSLIIAWSTRHISSTISALSSGDALLNFLIKSVCKQVENSINRTVCLP